MKPLLLEEIKHAVHGELKTALVKEPITGVSTDSRRVGEGDLFVALRGDRFDGHDFVEQAIEAGARGVLVDRNLPLSPAIADGGVCLMKVDDTTVALGELARFYRRGLGRRVTVVAVTGSNGKTTTREMIYHVLSKKRRGYRSPASYNNRIGVPLTLLGVEPAHEFVIAELGSSAPGELRDLSRMVEPDVAVITHVGPAHLEGFKDVDSVSVEKVSIVTGLAERGIIVCSTEHQPTWERVRALQRPMVSFGLDRSADVWAQNVRSEHGKIRFETNDHCQVVIPIGGVHNVSNALAALAVVRRLGVSTNEFAAALADFGGVSSRMEYHHVNDITIIDDSYNANPASMAAALAELVSHDRAGRRILVCGDMCELGVAAEQMHCELGRQVAASDIDMLFTVGPQAAWTANAAVEAGMGKGSVQRAINSRRLARLIKSAIRDEDVILVKGSRAMQTELVVAALRRYRGGRRPVLRVSGAKAITPAGGAPMSRRPLVPQLNITGRGR